MNREAVLARGPVIRRWVLLALVFGVPTLFLRSANDPINVPKLSLLMFCVAIAAGIRVLEITQGAPANGLRWMWVPAVAVVAPLFIAWVASPYRGWAVFGHYPRFTGLLPYIVVAVAGILIADAFAGRTIEIAWAFAAAGAVVGAYATVQKVGLDPFDWEVGGGAVPVVSSTLGNPDFVGGLLAVALPISVALWFLDVERRRWVAAAVALSAAGWLVSFSQGGWGAGVAGLAVFGSFVAAGRIPRARLLGAFVAASIALAGVGVVLVSIVSEQEAGATATRRADWWVAAADMTAASPLVGRGPSSFAIEHSRYRTFDDAAVANLAIENDPHNVFLSFATGAGLLGALGFGAFVFWGVWRGLQLADGNLLGAAFFGAFIAYGVQALVSIDTVALRTAGWVTLGALVASSVPENKALARPGGRKKRGQPEPLRRLVLVLVTLLVTGAVSLWSANFGLVDMRFRQATRTLVEGDVNSAAAQFDSVLGFRDEVQYRRTYAREVGNLAVGLARDGHTEPADILYDRAAEAFEPLEDFPYAPVLVERARILQNWGGLDPATGISNVLLFDFDPAAENAALALYKQALNVDPLDPAVISEGASLAVGLERPELAYEFLEPVVDRFDRADLWGHFAVAAAHTGQDQEARDAADRALALDPAQAEALRALELLDSRK